MTSGLQTAIARLYETFAPYAIHPKMDYCEHCISKKDVADLVAKPLQTLTSEDVRGYASNALTTWGSTEDFKHFLPRMMELLVLERGFFVDPEILFGKLSYANWSEWPTHEVKAVGEFLRMFWLTMLTNSNSTIDADTALCAIGNAEANLSPYLDTWIRLEAPEVAKCLAEFINYNLPVIKKKGKLANPFWEDHAEQAKQVLEWLKGAGLRRRIEEYAKAYADKPLGEKLMSTAERLQLLSH